MNMNFRAPFACFGFVVVTSVFGAATALAQESPPPPAQVIGPQSVVEKYDAPVVQPEKLEGLIDFPKLISAPGANDGAEVTPSLARLEIEILGTDGADTTGEFVHFLGASRSGAQRGALYAALRAKLAKYRDLPTTLGDVRFIQQDIAEVYAERGYPLMSVVVPPQEIVGGVVRVQINEFRLAAYRMTFGDGAGGYGPGNVHWSNASRLTAMLEPLTREPIISRAALDAAVRRINRNPYRQARVVFEPSSDLGQTTATFQIDERRPWGLQAGYNNHATKASGTHRFSLGGSLGNLPLEDQQISWNATVGPRLAEFQNYSLVYTVPLADGAKLTANLNYSDTASSSIPGINSASTTAQTSLGYDRTLRETEKGSWVLSATTMLKQFERESIFGDVTVGGAAYDSVQVLLNNQFSWREPAATNQVVIGVIASLAGLTGRNTDENFRTFYNSATGRATTLHFTVNYARVQQLGAWSEALADWNAETQISWQHAGRELAGSDAFALGGAAVMRAYPSSAISGDRGVYLVQFLHLKPVSLDGTALANAWVNRITVSPLFEAGWAGYATGVDEQVWDAGLQVALDGAKNFSLTASLAFVGKTVGETQRGDARAFVAARWSY